MTSEPRFLTEYGDRQVEAARRVMIDIGQVLGSYVDDMVLIGGWVPDLIIPNPAEAHTGSIDVDLLLNADKLTDGGYAELLQQLLDTRRYQLGSKAFQLVTEVDLKDGGGPISVEVDFLAPRGSSLEKNPPKLIEGFRVLEVDVSSHVFDESAKVKLPGKNTLGTENVVQLRVLSGIDFLVMKAFALQNRDKPKDAYDICYVLDNTPGGLEKVAEEWRARSAESETTRAEEIFREKFSTVGSFGPQQVVQFHDESGADAKDIRARRAYELMRSFLEML